MSSYVDLMKQIADLQAQADAMAREEKIAAVLRVKDIMREYGVTLSDLGGLAQPRSGRKGVAVPPKYRHPASGALWSGRGQKPRWLREEMAKGRTADDFLIERVS
ncbi:putative Histone-like nucleoid-structuring protein H-NS [Thiomonas arsenitoxydans]|uniref:Histone-like nucleoid-structuring protein H-NS n=1 Tax=Thiomonas arsenitoxydans (strain DSM 22701 / CIP 110005 / 3As) TaxID=426114 RepID=D6CVS7_THIA3|nr:H-NS histone family protein [Thiomonas arsenitoxydans]CAZ90416.1 putative Histone-like nucleoid-structuring protein H-NS [Thiomonas arsenitoxydans]CQR32739.1 putative Histone-like nucleoid-structuring protein H-NS [Thiomonas arsenitoxydans]CQR45765.1 putative Histone-like nucleoid-structuring protein H-NS [Thiomonas sp. CB3]